MPVLFNFVRKKREGGEGEERKTEEREREREISSLWLYYEISCLERGKTRYLASWIFGKPCSSNFILFNFEERGESAWEAKRDKAMVIFITPVFFIPKMLEPENKFRGNYKITLVVYAVFVWQCYGCPSFVSFHTVFNCFYVFLSLLHAYFYKRITVMMFTFYFRVATMKRSCPHKSVS